METQLCGTYKLYCFLSIKKMPYYMSVQDLLLSGQQSQFFMQNSANCKKMQAKNKVSSNV